MNEINKLFDYCISGNRVCPKPQLWNKLWQLLKNKKQVGSCWQPPLPLILAAWDTTSDKDKQLRLREHITWADMNGQIIEISDFLYRLNEDEWYHEKE